MLDYLSAHIPLTVFTRDEVDRLQLIGDRIVRYDPKNGNVRYITTAWDNIRSDSHAITYRVGSDLWLQGSPARVIGSGDAVFGSGASANEDIRGCLDRMVMFLLDHLELETKPALEIWEVTRVDITRNLLLDSLAEVRQSLAYLRNAEGGRLRVNQPDGDTVYWQKSSRHKKAKAYAKGPHLQYLTSKKGYTGYPYDQEEIKLASRLIRLELTIFKRYWQKVLEINHWSRLTPNVLDDEWHKFFNNLLGHTIMNDEELRKMIDAVAPTVGQAKAAYTAWYLIKSMGWEMAQESMTKSTWYRNLKILKAAGLKVTDLGNCKIIPFKTQKLVLGKAVNNWSELRKAA